jgi:hypothetical protein
VAASIYIGDSSAEIADLRKLLVDQIRQAGLNPLTLDDSERQDDADLLERVRAKIRAADQFVGVVAFKRGWEPASLDGYSLTEVEYGLARGLRKPVTMLMPRPDGDLAQSLRQRAMGQSPASREAQKQWMRQVERDSRVLWFGDEAELLAQITLLLAEWQAMNPPQAAPSNGFFQSWWNRMIDLDGLAQRIAEQIHLKLWSMQRQPDMVEQAMMVQEALRLKPGELVFGRPLSGSQFQSDVFVIMPFAPELDPVYRGVIKPLMSDMNLRSVRGDEFASRRGSIIEEVWAALNNCQLVIADITGGNDNVFYELGIAHTLNKPAIIITQAETPEGVPFDIRHLRYVPYRNTDEGRARLRIDLEAALRWLLADLQESWG